MQFHPLAPNRILSYPVASSRMEWHPVPPPLEPAPPPRNHLFLALSPHTAGLPLLQHPHTPSLCATIQSTTLA